MTLPILYGLRHMGLKLMDVLAVGVIACSWISGIGGGRFGGSCRHGICETVEPNDRLRMSRKRYRLQKVWGVPGWLCG